MSMNQSKPKCLLVGFTIWILLLLGGYCQAQFRPELPDSKAFLSSDTVLKDLLVDLESSLEAQKKPANFGELSTKAIDQVLFQSFFLNKILRASSNQELKERIQSRIEDLNHLKLALEEAASGVHEPSLLYDYFIEQKAGGDDETLYPSTPLWGIVDSAIQPTAPHVSFKNTKPIDSVQSPISQTPLLDLIPATYQQNPVELLRFIQTEIAYQPYWGSIRDSRSVLTETAGNDLDICGLFSDLLWEMGVANKIHFGTVQCSLESLQSLLKVQDGSSTAEVLTSVGIPYQPVMENNTLVGFQIEHFWVEAYLPLSHYRGTEIGQGDHAWIPMDPAFSILEQDEFSHPLQDIEIDSEEWCLAFESDPQRDGFVFLNQQLAAIQPDLNFVSLADRFSSPERGPNLLELALPWKILERRAIYDRVPSDMMHVARIRVSDETGSDIIDGYIPLRQFYAASLTWDAEPASAADRELVALYGSRWRVPPDLLHLVPVFKLGSVTLGDMKSRRTFLPGDLVEVSIQVLAPNQIFESISNMLPVGGFSVLKFQAPQNVLSTEPLYELQPDDPLGNLLSDLMRGFLQRTFFYEQKIGGSFRTQALYPTAAFSWSHLDYEITTGTGGRQVEMNVKALRLDAEFRPTHWVPESEEIQGTALNHARLLSGLTTAQEEGLALEALSPEIEAVSVPDVFKQAHVNGLTPIDLTLSDISRLDEDIHLPEPFENHLRTYLQDGLQVRVLANPYPTAVASLSLARILEVQTGRTAWLMHPQYSGSVITIRIEDLSEDLKNLFLEPWSSDDSRLDTDVYWLLRDPSTSVTWITADRTEPVPIRYRAYNSVGRPVPGAVVELTISKADVFEEPYRMFQATTDQDGEAIFWVYPPKHIYLNDFQMDLGTGPNIDYVGVWLYSATCDQAEGNQLSTIVMEPGVPNDLIYAVKSSNPLIGPYIVWSFIPPEKTATTQNEVGLYPGTELFLRSWIVDLNGNSIANHSVTFESSVEFNRDEPCYDIYESIYARLEERLVMVPDPPTAYFYRNNNEREQKLTTLSILSDRIDNQITIHPGMVENLNVVEGEYYVFRPIEDRLKIEPEDLSDQELVLLIDEVFRFTEVPIEQIQSCSTKANFAANPDFISACLDFDPISVVVGCTDCTVMNNACFHPEFEDPAFEWVWPHGVNILPMHQYNNDIHPPPYPGARTYSFIVKMISSLNVFQEGVEDVASCHFFMTCPETVLNPFYSLELSFPYLYLQTQDGRTIPIQPSVLELGNSRFQIEFALSEPGTIIGEMQYIAWLDDYPIFSRKTPFSFVTYTMKFDDDVLPSFVVDSQNRLAQDTVFGPTINPNSSYLPFYSPKRWVFIFYEDGQEIKRSYDTMGIPSMGFASGTVFDTEKEYDIEFRYDVDELGVVKEEGFSGTARIEFIRGLDLAVIDWQEHGLLLHPNPDSILKQSTPDFNCNPDSEALYPGFPIFLQSVFYNHQFDYQAVTLYGFESKPLDPKRFPGPLDQIVYQLELPAIPDREQEIPFYPIQNQNVPVVFSGQSARTGGHLYWGLVGVKPNGELVHSNLAFLPYKFPLQGIGVTNGKTYEQDYVYYLEEDPAAVEESGNINVQRDLGFKLSHRADVRFRFDGQTLLSGPLEAGSYKVPVNCNYVGKRDWEFRATFQTTPLPDGTSGEPVTIEETGSIEIVKNIKSKLNVGATSVKGVNLASGSLNIGSKDIDLPGLGKGLSFSRNYSSAGGLNWDPMGLGWTHNFQSRLLQSDGNKIKIVGGDGSGMVFDLNPSTQLYEPDMPGIHSQLVKNEDGSFTLITKDGSKWAYGFPIDPNGSADAPFSFRSNLMSIEDSFGNRLHLSYDSESGRLYRVTDPSGRALNFTYGKVRNYHLLKSVHTSGVTPQIQVEFEHDAFGRLVKASRGDKVETYAYQDHCDVKSERDKLVAYTNPNGHTTTYTYHNATGGNGNPLAAEFVHKVIEPEGLITTFAYGNYLDPLKSAIVTDGIASTSYFFNFAEQVERIEGPLGTTLISWVPNDVLKQSETDPSGRLIEYGYDINGNMIEKITHSRQGSQSHTESWEYDLTWNKPLSSTDKNGNTTVYQLDNHGAIVQKTDPEGNTTELAYDENGNLVEIKDPRGFITEIDYDNYGNPIRTTLPDGTRLHKTFDSRGRLLTEEKKDQSQIAISFTEFQYDDLDHLIQIDVDAEQSGGKHVIYEDIKPMGQVGRQIDGTVEASFAYDELDRLIEERIDPGGNQPVLLKTYRYDLHGNIIEKKLQGQGTNAGETRRFTMTYDDADRLLNTTLNNLSYQKLTYEQGTHLISTQTDWKGAQTRWGYDGFDRPIRKTLPVSGGYVERTGYDPQGNAIWQQDGNGNRSTFEYDGNHRMVRQINALGQRSENTYDANGNLLKIEHLINGSGVAYVYDEMNRVTRETRFNETGSGDQVTTRVYTQSGFGIEVTPPEDQSITTQRNALGQVISRVQGGITTGYTYDVNGHVSRIQHPEGYETIQVHDGFGRLISEIAPENVTQTNEYDIHGNLVRHIDARGVETTTTFDSYNRPLSQTRSFDEASATETWSYVKSMGQVTRTYIDFRGNTTIQVYDGLGRLLSTEDSTRGATATQTWDALNLIEKTDFKGNPTRYSYDAINRLILETDALSGTQKTQYDDKERTIVHIDRKGIETKSVLDQVGNTLSTTRSGVIQSQQVYDLQNRPLSSTDASGVVQSQSYDGLGRLMTQSVGSGADIQTTTYSDYDDLGRPAKTDDGLQTIERTYDYYGRTLTETNGNDETTQFTYDPIGNLLTKTRPAPHDGTATWTYSYDLINQLTSVTEPNQALTQYQWESQWTMLQITDAENEVSTRLFDPVGRLLQIQTPGLGTSYFTYDANDNPESTQRPMGVVSFEYDDLNRLEREVWSGNPDPNFSIFEVSYQYDENHNPTLITQTGSEGTSSRAITYDDWNRPTSILDDRGFQLQVGYRENGTRDHVIYPNGVQVAYQYDAANRLRQASIPGIGQAKYSYYDNGLIASMQEGPDPGVNGDWAVDTQLTYDPANRLQSMATTRADGHTTAYELTWLPDGSRASLTETRSDLGAWSTTYHYDMNSRLTGWTRQTPTHECTTSYDLDAVGNRTYETETGDGYNRERSYSYQTGHRLEQFTETVTEGGTSVVDRTVTFQYDVNGNRTQKADTNALKSTTAITSMTWDARNRMRRVVTPSGLTTEFNYDDLNRRIRKSTDNRGTGPVLYSWDELAVVNEYTEGSGPGQHFEQATYAFGKSRMAMLRPGFQPQWITHDPMSSLADLIADDGSLIEAKTYTPFGTPETIHTSATGGYNNHGFTGHEYDPETNLTYAKARFYDQDLGIFIGQDPEIGQFDTPPSLHRFQYAYANPLVFWDPTGMNNDDVNNIDEEDKERHDTVKAGARLTAMKGKEFAGYMETVFEEAAYWTPPGTILELAQLLDENEGFKKAMYYAAGMYGVYHAAKAIVKRWPGLRKKADEVADLLLNRRTAKFYSKSQKAYVSVEKSQNLLTHYKRLEDKKKGSIEALSIIREENKLNRARKASVNSREQKEIQEVFNTSIERKNPTNQRKSLAELMGKVDNNRESVAPNTGPGLWEWKGRRSGAPLEHQSNMTGKPIRVRSDGVSEIQEYVVNGVAFDDFAEGVLIDHKSKMPSFMFDENGFLKPGMKGPAQWRAEAIRQVEAANGLPVEWVVDPQQVKAFDTILQDIPGVSVRR